MHFMHDQKYQARWLLLFHHRIQMWTERSGCSNSIVQSPADYSDVNSF